MAKWLVMSYTKHEQVCFLINQILARSSFCVHSWPGGIPQAGHSHRARRGQLTQPSSPVGPSPPTVPDMQVGR